MSGRTRAEMEDAAIDALEAVELRSGRRSWQEWTAGEVVAAVLDAALPDWRGSRIAYDGKRRDPEGASIDELMARFGSLGPVTWPG